VSNDSVQVEACKAISDKTACEASSHSCEWNGNFNPIYHADCNQESAAKLKIKEETDKTLAECQALCISTTFCYSFSHGIQNKKCILYKKGCAPLVNALKPTLKFAKKACTDTNYQLGALTKTDGSATAQACADFCRLDA